MTELSFADAHFPDTPAEAYADMREIAAGVADDLRMQSARERIELEAWCETHFRPGIRALALVDVATDAGIDWVRHLFHLTIRASRRTVAAARLRCRRMDDRLAARMDDHTQHHLAHGLLAATAAIAMLAGMASLPTSSTSNRYQVDRLADGRVAKQEAIGQRLPVASSPAEAKLAAPVSPISAGAAAAPAVAERGGLPTGKGMWLYLPERVEGGNPKAIVHRAKAVGLTHLYVRTGSSKSGFYAQDFLNRLLPVAHEAGIRVYGWDFPYLDDPSADVNRAMAAITHTAPGGHRIDGFSADIELRSMGVNISPETATYYGENLRRMVGDKYPLIATVPRPSPYLRYYPFPQVVEHFDAIAPMVYWMNRDPGADVGGAIAELAQFGKPIIPVGQAYDGGAEGGPAGVPPAAQIQLFLQVAEEQGASAVSFWSWQHADQQAWDAITQAPQFTLPAAPDPLSTFQIRAYQHLLRSLGYIPGTPGQLDQPTLDAIRSFQSARNLRATGVIDSATRGELLRPVAPPIG